MFSNSIAIIDDDIFVEIKDMLFEAKKDEKVYLVTPYVRFDDKIREQIKDAKARKVDVRLLVRKGEERTDEDSTFLANNGIEVRELAYLHAKVYLSKRLGVISSINLYDISDKRNKEVAVIIQSRFKLKAIFEIVERWWSNAEKVSAAQLATASLRVPFGAGRPEPRTIATITERVLPEIGFCISGRESVPFDYDKPLCKKHYDLWKPDLKSYKGNYCHLCGERITQEELHINHPLCAKCYGTYKSMIETRRPIL